jgi:formate/nitrite transporter FocA (FNT family)
MKRCVWHLAMVAGVLLGAMFFGGLWWTVRKGVSFQAAGALVLRQPAAADEHRPGWILLCCPAVIGSGCWCVCLGFVMARLIVTRLTGPPVEHPNAPARRPVMRLSPDEIIFWQYGFFKLNATIVFTWGLMLVLAVGSKLITRSFPRV